MNAPPLCPIRIVATVLFALLWITVRPSVAAAQITSTAAGGSWRDGGTWMGGQVPGENDDVVIAGPVVVRTGDTCRNLTVNAAGRIVDADDANFGERLVVRGDATNAGTVVHGNVGQLYVNVGGDLQNAGTWAPDATVLNGAGTQRLSLAGGAAFSGRMTIENQTGAVQAATNLRFTQGVVDLQQKRLEMMGFSVETDDTFVFEDGVLAGPVTLLGTQQIASGAFSMEGDVTNAGILEGHPQASFTDFLPVKGRLINDGVIRNGTGQFRLDIDGEAHNAGTWEVYLTRFTGTSGQRLSADPGHVFSGGLGTTGAEVTIEAGSDLTFVASTLDLDGGTLQMGTYDLTLDEGTAFYDSNVDVRNLTMHGNATLGAVLSVAPDVTLHGTVQVHTTTTFEGDVTVADTLRDALDANFMEEAFVMGSLHNDGVVTGLLNLAVAGDVINSGVWDNNATTLNGSGSQTIATDEGTPLGGRLIIENETGAVQASTDLFFSGGVFDLQQKRLEMQGHAVTTDDTFVFEDGIVAGPLTTRGTLQVIRNGFGVEGTLTNEGVIEAHPAGSFTDLLPIAGRLVNRGEIRDGFGQFQIDLDGEAQNEGVWGIYFTRFTGTEGQRLSMEEGAVLSGGWGTSGEDVTVEAASDLSFDAATIDLQGGMLGMGDFALSLDGGSALYNGHLDTRSLTASGNSTIGGALDVAPGVTLRGAVQAYSGTVFDGAVTVADTLRDAPAGSFIETIEVKGQLVNDGVITGLMSLVATGDLINEGTWDNNLTALAGRGRRTIRGTVIASPVRVIGDEVVFTGDVHLDRLDVAGDAFARVSSEGALYLPSGGLTGALTNFTNFGRVVMHAEALPNRRLDFFDASVRTAPEVPFDTLFVETYGNQVPTSYTAAVRNWWRLRPNVAVQATLPSITFTYDDQQLGANDEGALKVFHSSDEGATWEQLSTSENLTLDAERNQVTLANAPATGDFVISSEVDPVSVIPNVIVSITGRTNIRIGAPNRYLIHYVNNSDQPTGTMLMALRVSPGAHITQVQPSTQEGVNVAPFSQDDLFDSRVPGDTLVFLWVEGMDPREERSLDVIATGGQELGDGTGKEAIVITLGAAVVFVANAILVDYLLDTASNYLEEITATSAESGRDVFQAAVDRTNEQWFGSFEKPGKSIIEASLETLWHRATGIILIPIDVVQLLTYDIPAALFKGGERFLNSPRPGTCRVRGLGQSAEGKAGASPFSIQDAGDFCTATYGTEVFLPAVRSWDPNEKDGPAGYGEEGFVSEAGQMNYTILFENKAEATAEAFRIVVYDTLSSALDPETVVFGEASHEGFTMMREGNVLRWEIEGIELPPNVNPPEGEGFVSFSVHTVPGLASGSAIANRATIVFDQNPPITTNMALNTLDFTPPVTTMQPLADHVEADAVVVRWHSDDSAAGAGVDVVNVYAAVDEGGYFFVGTSDADSLVVPVEQDAQYRFYALAVDHVGNAEMVRPEPVATNVTIPVATEDQALPGTFSLGQNYPNPFNPSTTITYTLPARSRTRLVVYDVLGRRVATLVDGVQAPGRYEVVWDARAVASGLYLYRLSSGTRVGTRTMLVVK